MRFDAGEIAAFTLACLGDDRVFGWHGIALEEKRRPGFDLEPPGS
jgi:hypothetical protein